MTISQNKKKYGFTLAEVLITLTVIGIVASLTIPTLMNNIDDQQFKTAYKRTFSELDQATRQLVSENGGSLKGLCSDSSCFSSVYAPYINYIKKCIPTELYGNCWNKHGEFKNFAGTPQSGWGNEAGFILNDGSFLFWGWTSGNCSRVISGVNVCAEVHVDINGFKPPNTIGKDIFRLHLLENKIMPNGAGDTSNIATDCAPGGSGWTCGVRYLSE